MTYGTEWKMGKRPFTWDFRGRRSIRIRGKYYVEPGDYFITMPTNGRKCLFGNITNSRMHLNSIGRMVADEWLKTPIIRKEISLGPWIIMPNHFHAIVTIKSPIESPVGAHGVRPVLISTDVDAAQTSAMPHDLSIPQNSNSNESKNQQIASINVRGAHRAPQLIKRDEHPRRAPRSLGSLVSAFKSATTSRYWRMLQNENRESLWQRNYYESVINSDFQYNNVQEYIMSNPEKW
jgi:putative transposase